MLHHLHAAVPAAKGEDAALTRALEDPRVGVLGQQVGQQAVFALRLAIPAPHTVRTPHGETRAQIAPPQGARALCV